MARNRVLHQRALLSLGGRRSNQSLERTRWARSVRFAGRQLWRAAQLQIR